MEIQAAVHNREVISIHIGQAGAQIGEKCWELYCLEHDLKPDGTINANTTELGQSPFFSETKSGKYVPRCVMFDSEPTCIDVIRTGPFKNLFEPGQLINGKEDAANNFARGKYTVAPTSLGPVLGQIQKLADDCSNIQGFLVFHSIGGGTGSGFSSLVIRELQEKFPKKPTLLFSVYPAATIASAVVDPYNAVLMTHNTSNYADCGIMVENQAVYQFMRSKLNLHWPQLNQLNVLIAQLASSITASLRFKGLLNVDMNEFATNLVPFPRVRYVVGTLSPVCSSEKVNRNYVTAEQITADCFDSGNSLFPCNPNFGKYVACCMLYRGDIVPREVNAAIASIRALYTVNFVNWCSTNFKVGLSSRPSVVTPGCGIARARRTLTMLANTTAISTVWDMLGRKFDMLFRKKAFLHWYTGEGMEIDEMTESRYDLAVLEHDYLEIDHHEELRELSDPN